MSSDERPIIQQALAVALLIDPTAEIDISPVSIDAIFVRSDRLTEVMLAIFETTNRHCYTEARPVGTRPAWTAIIIDELELDKLTGRQAVELVEFEASAVGITLSIDPDKRESIIVALDSKPSTIQHFVSSTRDRISNLEEATT